MLTPSHSVLTGGVTCSDVSRAGRPATLDGLEAAIRAAWSLDTCDPSDAAEWTPANPARGQCAVTALVVHDLLGGQLLEAEVHHADGSARGFHYWNRLAGLDVDLTSDQFTDREVVGEPHLVERLASAPWLAHDQYLILRDRVRAALGLPAARAG